MAILIWITMGLLTTNNELTVFDFNSAENSGKWYTVNDDVMGGISESDVQLNTNGTATFKGHVSLENNGGFASIRTQIQLNENSNYKGVAIRIKGDGNVYSLRFRTNNNFDGYAYQAKVKSEKDTWKEFSIPFEEFKATYRGHNLKDKPALESKDIVQVGFLISDKQAGNFELEIDWLKFY